MSDPPHAMVVALVTDPEDKFGCLRSAIEQAGLKQALELRCRQAGLSGDQLRVFIKPDLSFYFRPATTITDPELVEWLVEWLHAAGYANITLGTARNSSSFWLENRDPMILADLAGYRFNEYDFADLSEDLCDGEFPSDSVLHGSPLNSAWKNAHFRISFAKAKTDEESVYAGAAQNLLGVLPHEDTELYYYHRLRPEDVCGELLRQTPVHFAVVDGFVSNQGSAGSRSSAPLAVSTIIAGGSVTLVDWALANKFGVDPYRSPIVAKLLREQGLPQPYQVVGTLTPFPAVKNVHPMVVDAVAKRNVSLDLQRSANAWLQNVDRQLFPFKDALTDRMNGALASRFADLDSDPLAFSSFLMLNYTFGGLAQMNESSKIIFAKEKLRWMERPLNISLQDLGPADYEASRTYMEPLEKLVMQSPPDQNGMRMQYLDNSVLFHFCRELPIAFDDFVSRVDISRSIRMMNDYIGGSCVPVVHDAKGRVTHQAERNIYLPQPNYTAYSGGQPIDVSKLEFVEYSDNERKIWWRTVKSENNSARYDDGTVTFTRTPANDTAVGIVGRQEFSLPVFWQMLNLDLNPALKNFLVADAYKTFFNKTLANFTADFEKREYRVGQPWTAAKDDPHPEPVSAKLASSVGEWAEKSRVEIDRITAKFSLRNPTPTPSFVDEAGFSHFTAPVSADPGPPTDALSALADKARLQNAATGVVDFFKDLMKAVNRDLTQPPTENSGTDA
jgi:hypothetical protein